MDIWFHRGITENPEKLGSFHTYPQIQKVFTLSVRVNQYNLVFPMLNIFSIIKFPF